MQRTASVAPICSQPSGLMRGSAVADGARTPTVISELTTAVATASAVVGMAAESLGDLRDLEDLRERIVMVWFL